MNTHYIPRLLLRQFAEKDKVNTYDFKTKSFTTKKLKNTFVEKDLFDEGLERAFAVKIEGPFGDILNHKLLSGDKVTIDRRENLLIRKFFMINFLRAPIINSSWDEMVEKTQSQEHQSVQMHRLMMGNPKYRKLFEENVPSDKTYISDLKRAMEISSLEDIADPKADVSHSLQTAARLALVTAYTIWDCTDTGLEFIFPKLPGINQMDNIGIFYKGMVMLKLKEQKKKEGMPELLECEIDRLIYGSMVYAENFGVYPISPTRAVICFSPYFRAFFPIYDPTNTVELYPALLDKKQFDMHFYYPTRMELFQPCFNIFNSCYQYSVKKLTANEVMMINSLFLNMETDEFVFHDFNKIRESLWFYSRRAAFATKKKHDFSQFV